MSSEPGPGRSPSPAAPAAAGMRPARRARLVAACGLVGLLAGAIALAAALRRASPPEPPEVGPAANLLAAPLELPAFDLRDAAGRPFGPERLRGRLTLLFFGYASCPDICPMTLGALRELRARVADRDPDLAHRLQVVFVSVDPERDTPERLRDYVAHFDPSFVGVTGDPEALAVLTRGLGIFHERHEEEGAAGYRVDHTASVLLVDGRGRLRALFRAPHEPEAMERSLLQIARHLAQEAGAEGEASPVRASPAAEGGSGSPPPVGEGPPEPGAPLRVEDARVVAPPPGAPAAGYLVLVNEGDRGRVLVGAESDAAERVEIHRTEIREGVARMLPQERVEVPPGGRVSFEPGGLHLMWMGPRSLEAGRVVPLRLRFADGSVLDVEVPVTGGAASPHAGAGAHHAESAPGHSGHSGHAQPSEHTGD